MKHYGYEFLYGSNTVDLEKPLVDGMPQECLPIIEKITSLECVKHFPDQLTINEYLAGQGKRNFVPCETLHGKKF